MKLKLLSLSLLAASFALAQQNTLTQTSLTVTVAKGQTALVVASATNITVTPPTVLMIYADMYYVTAVNGLAITAIGGQSGSFNVAHASGDMVLVGRPDWFTSVSPLNAGCTAANTYVTPLLLYPSGLQFLCSTITLKWVPGWQNEASTAAMTTAVASAAGLVTPSGPLFHITGALAITGFNIPVGFFNDTFTVIPDGAFTTTTASNIAIASTAVVGRPMTFTYDPATSKFYPSY